MTDLTDELRDKLDAMTFRRLLSHLDRNKDVQNIDLMIVANFCRNCLGDWYQEAAKSEGLTISREEARERVYGMPYSQWKDEYQREASSEQVAAFEARKKG